jgi:prepilin-type N-terminal cleavage/methylation domain-containing protein
MTRQRARAGFTLIELLVTLAILGIVSSVVVLAFRVPAEVPHSDSVAQVLAARRRAFREGRRITIDIVTEGGVRTASAHPDGSIVADPEIRIGRIDIVDPGRRQ